MDDGTIGGNIGEMTQADCNAKCPAKGTEGPFGK
jgi:hypothetical protein